MKRKLATLGLISALALPGCRNRDERQGGTSGQTIIRFGTLFRALDYAPYYVAREKGWLDEALRGKARLEHLETFQSPPSANEAMAADRVDVVLTADVPAIVARSSGVKLRLPMLSCTLNSQVLVHPGSKLSKLSQLKGKRVAVAFGTGPHFGLLRQLKEQNLDPQAVELLDMTPPDAKAAFLSGAVDGWAIFPPFIEQEVIGGSGEVLAGVESPVQVVVSVREGFSQAHPEEVKLVLGALRRAKAWLSENPEQAQEMLGKLLELDLPVVKLGWQRLDWTTGIDDEKVKTDLEDKSRFLVDRGYTKRKIAVASDLLVAAVPE